MGCYRVKQALLDEHEPGSDKALAIASIGWRHAATSQAHNDPPPCRPAASPRRARRQDRLPDLRTRKHWRPAQIKARIEPVRGLYDLRHTYATFALRAGVPVFAVSRFIGSSIAMIDRHYGHLARDSREHAVALVDALALERAVDAAWTSTGGRANALNNCDSRPRRRRNHRRVDARWTPQLVLVASADNENS